VERTIYATPVEICFQAHKLQKNREFALIHNSILVIFARLQNLDGLQV